MSEYEKKEILVEIKSVYGQEKIYPICPHAKMFAAIAGTKTLTLEVVAQIKKMGFPVKVISSQTI